MTSDDTIMPVSLLVGLRDADGAPLRDAFLSLMAKTNYKNSFWFLFGPTDGDGQIEIRWSEVERRAEETARFAIMDYGQFRNSFTGELVFHLADEDRLARAKRGFREYQRYFSYPSDYEKQLDRSIGAVRRIRGGVFCALTILPNDSNLRVELCAPLIGK